VHVHDHDRRKPHQDQEIHVDDYHRVQDVNPHPAPGATELGPRTDLSPDDMMSTQWGVMHEPVLPYDPTVFNPRDVIQSIADENEVDLETAAKVHEWLVKNDPDQLEPLEEVSDEGETIPVPDPDVVQEALNALGYPGHHGNIDRQTEQIEAIEKELHPKEITAIDFSHVGRVDLGVPSGKYHKWERTTQKEAIEKIKQNGADVLVGNEDGSVHRYNLKAALRARDYFDLIEKKTGKKVIFHPHLEVGRKEDGLAFPTLEQARHEVPFVRPNFERLGVKPIIVMQQNGYIEYPKRPAYVYLIASDNTATWQCWDGVYKEV
jgi:hypothetical protein